MSLTSTSNAPLLEHVTAGVEESVTVTLTRYRPAGAVVVPDTSPASERVNPVGIVAPPRKATLAGPVEPVLKLVLAKMLVALSTRLRLAVMGL